jgi:hypothetical protein
MPQRRKKDIMRFAGSMKNERKKLEELNAMIVAEGEANYGRDFESK